MAGGQSALLAAPIHPLNGLGASAVQGHEPGPARRASGFGKVRHVDGSARLMAPTAEPLGIACPAPVNSGPQHHYVAQAALAHLDRWARGGPPPPSSPRLQTDPDDRMRLVTDDAGIARGGIRTGWVDVPVAALSGLSPPGATGIGILLGSTRVFDAAELARRYPAGPGEYAAAFREATMRAAAAGFVLEQDVDEMVAVAAAAYPAR